MKRNKKRALLSAIAMLIVSAITLSSATFAWFTVGDTASIGTITASVKSASSIEVSANNTDWNATLTQLNLTYDAVTNNTVQPDNSFPLNLSAISTPATTDPTGTGMPFYIGTLANTKLFTVTEKASTAAVSASIVKFTFWIRAAANTNVTYAGTGFTGNTALVSTYAAMQIGTTDADAASTAPIVYTNLLGNNFKPITGTGSGNDANSNGIMDSGEGFTNLAASPVSTTRFLTAPVIALTAGVARQVIVYMWLEGQDSECKVATGGATGDATLALAFEKA